MAGAPIDMTRCPQCKGRITHEPRRTGLMAMHVLPGGGLVFLCPDPVPPPASQKKIK